MHLQINCLYLIFLTLKMDNESFKNHENLPDFVSLGDLTNKDAKKTVRTKGFVQNIKVGKKYTFLVLRDKLITLQGIIPTSDDLKSIHNESYVEAVGTLELVKNEIKSCTISFMELNISSLIILSKSNSVLPFTYKDASYTQEELTKYNMSPVAYHLCLDNRSLYLRTPKGYAFTRILDGVMFQFRNFLRQNNFVEIKTPKLIGGASEGGANCFTVDYFKKTATLAQSPQLYKQMCIIGGLKRVYEIGHVYRAEDSNINRYLSEFIGLDLEMEISHDYLLLIEFIYDLLKSIFNFLNSEYSEEIEVISKYFDLDSFSFTESPVILSYVECMGLLKEVKGIEMRLEDDFNNENEKLLGEIVKEKYKTDIFVIKDYPACCRPFYTATMEDEQFTKSYDFIIRGEEILSGAQRVHSYDLLKSNIERKGINVESLGGYLEAFKFGVPPHGGCGIGLERLVKAYLGIKDIRNFSLFPRDPNRLYP